MMQHITELLQNAQLQQQVRSTRSMAESIKMLVRAGAENGYSLTKDNIEQAVRGLILEENELSETELLAVAGGVRDSSITGSILSCC